MCLLLLIDLTFVPGTSAARPPQRIISLAPNLTEILFALGIGDRVVGITSFCDYPAAAKNKARVGGMSNPSLETVVSLRPDLVIVTTDGNPKEFEERLRSLHIKTFIFTARRIAELPGGIRQLGGALGVKERAEALAAEIEKRTTAVQDRKGAKKKVLLIVWPEPLIVAGSGSIADDAIAILGGVNIAGHTPMAYPKYSIEEIIHRSPDLIFIGKGHADMRTVSQGLLKRLRSLPVVMRNRVFFVGDYLYRLGPRTIQGMEELAAHMGEQK